MKIKLLTSTAKVPTRGSEHAAGYDIYSDNDEAIHIVQSSPKSISTGIAVQIPHGFVGIIQPRSGLAFGEGIDTMAGIIDSDYRGEIKVLLTTHDVYGELRIDRGQRIAQLLVIPRHTGDIELVSELDDTTRGDNGFGSSGSN